MPIDYKKILFLISGKIEENVCYYDIDNRAGKVNIKFSNNSMVYPYNQSKVRILEDPEIISPISKIFKTINGKVLDNISVVYCFKDYEKKYYRFIFNDGDFESYPDGELIISDNILNDARTISLIDYFKAVAKMNNLRSEKGEVLLAGIYSRITHVDSKSVLAYYLCGKEPQVYKNNVEPIFPFGCNLSQIQAVNNALSGNISIIEGPPGTGKTQTILNIIANVIMQEKTVLVVSNNGSATDNVFEKLQKYGFDFIAAQMGKGENQKEFIANRQVPYPDFSKYPIIQDEKQYKDNLNIKLNELIKLFESRNRLAELEKMHREITLEQKYYLDYYNSTFDNEELFNKKVFPSGALLDLWSDLQGISEMGKRPDIIKRLIYKFRYKIKNIKSLRINIDKVIAYVKKLYYENKIREISQELQEIKAFLDSSDMNGLSEKLYAASTSLLKHELKKKYSSSVRRVFDENFWKYPNEFLYEYPVILSTTFSARSCFKGMMYDYVIVDEASQVDLACGVVAMTCAKNIVIVGDLKQLPNVVTEEDKEKLAVVGESSKVPDKYRCEKNSLLSSVCEVFPTAPRALLKEHYRCHPRIIDFCNKKFYGGQLIIMTEDHDEENVLKAHITVVGNHARGHYNQRQIDEITKVILPELKSNDVGIIAPYNAQTKAIQREITDQIPISTVHKFQGRENDDIIISTVDNEITEFTDNPNMLNVAVSRAKKRLRIVISNNEANDKTNIGELVRYIQYNNFEVQHSDLYSVFDMLYKEYETKRRIFLQKHKRISEYDSENLMYGLIEDTLQSDKFNSLDVICHQPLSIIIRDLHLLSDVETKYVMHPNSHIDFVIYNRIDKTLLLAVEVDGYEFHKENTTQYDRDMMKNHILELYNIPLLRFSTVGSGEKEKLINKLNEII